MGISVNKNIDVLLNIYINEFKSLICQILLTSKLICLFYNCIFYIINLLEIYFYMKKNKQKINNLINRKYKYQLLENGFSKKDILIGKKVLNSRQITMASFTRKFEIAFAKKIGAKYALMVNSGSSANLLATFAAGNLMRKNSLKRGDEVLVPALCWSTSIWPLVQFGLKLKFIDIDLETLNIKIDELKKNISKKTKAIMLINVLGISSNLFDISKLAKKKI